MERVFTTEFAGKTLNVETGKYAQQAGGSCIIRIAVIQRCWFALRRQAKPREGIDFFPLSCEYEERMYSVGKIPGGFIKREGTADSEKGDIDVQTDG